LVLDDSPHPARATTILAVKTIPGRIMHASLPPRVCLQGADHRAAAAICPSSRARLRCQQAEYRGATPWPWARPHSPALFRAQALRGFAVRSRPARAPMASMDGVEWELSCRQRQEHFSPVGAPTSMRLRPSLVPFLVIL